MPFEVIKLHCFAMLVRQMFLLYLETHFISPKISLEQDSRNPEIENHKLFSISTDINKQKKGEKKTTTKKPPPTTKQNKKTHNSLPSLKFKPRELIRKGQQ